MEEGCGLNDHVGEREEEMGLGIRKEVEREGRSAEKGNKAFKWREERRPNSTSICFGPIEEDMRVAWLVPPMAVDFAILLTLSFLLS